MVTSTDTKSLVCNIAADLDPVEGDNTLGTLTFKTKDGSDARTQVQVHITFFSIGPSFSNRDDYTANDLNMGITINK